MEEVLRQQGVTLSELVEDLEIKTNRKVSGEVEGNELHIRIENVTSMQDEIYTIAEHLSHLAMSVVYSFCDVAEYTFDYNIEYDGFTIIII